MRQRTELRQRQKPEFNARFSAAVRVLQMPSSELAEEVRDVLDSNPLLEEFEPELSDKADEFYSPGEYPPPASNASEIDTDDILELAAHAQSVSTIRDHLVQQIRNSGLSGRQRVIVEMIVESVDDRGYLAEPLTEILEVLPPDVDLREVELALAIVQQFDPPGVAARNLQECLYIQLDHIKASKTVRKNAQNILLNHLELLSDMELGQISIKSECDLEEVRAAVDLIQSLNPAPGNEFGASAVTVVPDVIARKIGDRWSVELNSDILPKLRISSSYQSMVRSARKAADTRYLKSSLNRATSFLEDLNRRHETILRVARTLVMHQQSFLEHGEHAMKPLTLREVAESLELHESTVSRTCSRKYIMTPRGTYELKYLFSYRIRSDTGEDESALSIKHKLLQLVEQEDGRSPLSDQQITEQLRGSGIRIARRTVAKYRSSMRIPTRRKRKAIAINQMPNREVM